MHMRGGRLRVQCPRRHAGAASRGNEVFVLEGLAGSCLLNSRSQNDLGGGPRTTRRYSAADAVTTQFDGLPHPPGSNPAVPSTPASSPTRQINSSKRHRWRSVAQ
jgi:hypothetical protein